MAYISPATIASVEPLPDGDLRLVIRFTGNSGESPVHKQYMVGESTTAADVRRYVYTTIRQLNGKRTLNAQAGDSIPELAPPGPVAPTAKERWLAERARLTALAAGPALTGAAATALANLIAAHLGAYQAGFLDA